MRKRVSAKTQIELCAIRDNLPDAFLLDEAMELSAEGSGLFDQFVYPALRSSDLHL